MFSASIAIAQIDTERIPPEYDLSDLYPRAVASRFVVIGTVVKTDGVSQRMTSELLRRVKDERDLSLALGGGLYTIRVESTVCRQTDFRADAYTSSEAPQTVYVFLPRDEPMFCERTPERNLAAQPALFTFPGRSTLAGPAKMDRVIST